MLFSPAYFSFLGLGSCVWFWLLAQEVRKRCFPGVSTRLVLLVYLCFSLGGVNAFLQAETSVYHEAILSGAFFTLAGAYFWLRALAGAPTSMWQLVLAGFLFGLGLGSRVSMFGYALGVGLVLVWFWMRAPSSHRSNATRHVLAFGLPVGSAIVLLLIYNHLRFDSPLEMGLKYQLGVFNEGPVLPDPRFLTHNVVAYFFYRPELVPYYPFQTVGAAAVAVGDLTWRLRGPFTSFIVLAPLSLLAPLALFGRPASRERAFIVSLSVGLFCALGNLLVLNWALARYMQDFLPAICLLGGIGLWSLYLSASSRRLVRLGLHALAGALLVTSVVAGFSLAVSRLNKEAGMSGPDREQGLRVSYSFDTAAAKIIRLVAPQAWPSSYLNEQTNPRTDGAFYVDQQRLTFPVRGTTPLRGLPVESAFSTPTRVTVEIDGRIVGEQRLRPGRQELRWSSRAEGGPIRFVSATLHFPEASTSLPLWPLNIDTANFSAVATTIEETAELRKLADRTRAMANEVRQAVETRHSLPEVSGDTPSTQVADREQFQQLARHPG